MPVTEYVWDDVNDCVLEETDELGASQVTYTHEPGAFGPLISEYRGGTTSVHHYDALGSTTMLTDDTGAVTDTFQFDAWGNQVVRTGTTPTPYTWVGRWGYQDDTATTGGYYIRARTYQPTITRWTSVDPILTFTKSQDTLYASNDPISRLDPSGLVDKFFKPVAPALMPWTEVGSNVPLDPNDTADPAGLDPVIYGRTSPVSYKTVCVCDCCIDLAGRCGQRVHCAVFSYLKIILSPKNIKHARQLGKRSPNKQPITLTGSYGHEQRHVENLIEAANQAATIASLFEGACLGPGICTSEASSAARLANNWMERARSNEENHRSASPSGNEMYPPMGKMPVKPDAAFPGTPPPPPTGKPCK